MTTTYQGFSGRSSYHAQQPIVDPKMTKYFDTVANAGVNYSMQDIRLWGSAFIKEGADNYSGIVASGFYLIMIKNLGFAPRGPFFSFSQDSWLDFCPYPVTPEQLASVIYRGIKGENTPPVIASVIFPLNNMINFMERMTVNERRESRVIIAPSPAAPQGRGLYIGRFKGNGEKFFRPEGRKPIMADTGIPSHYLEPDIPYRFVVTKELPDRFLAQVIEPYSLARIGLIHSPHGYFPKDPEKPNYLENLPYYRIFPVNLPETIPLFPPTHLDANLFHMLLRTCLFSGADFVEVGLSGDVNTPIRIRTLNSISEAPYLEMILATLNPFLGPQRR